MPPFLSTFHASHRTTYKLSPFPALNRNARQPTPIAQRSAHSLPDSGGGFWRDTLPAPTEMQNGRWAGKGRCFVFAQVIETLIRASGRDCGWKRMRKELMWREETARRQREWEEKGRPESGSGGFDDHAFKKSQWKARAGPRYGGRSQHNHSGPWGAGWSHDRRGGYRGQGTGAGPFDPNAFKREFWWSTIEGAYRRRRHHNFKKDCAPLECMDRYIEAARYKTGLFYFLTHQVPRGSPEYKRPVAVRPPIGHHHAGLLPAVSGYYSTSSTASLARNSRSYSTSPFLRPPHSHHSKDDHHHHHFDQGHARHHSMFNTAVLRLPVICNLRPGSSTVAICFKKLLCTAANAMRSTSSVQTHSAYACLQGHLLWPFVALLKSSAALNVVTWASRIALTLLPLSVRGKIIHVIKQRYFENPNASRWIKNMVESRNAATPSGLTSHINAVYILPTLLLMPVVLLGATIIASYERTPVTGRPRIVMLSPTEEEELVSGILAVGGSETDSASRDWVTILRSVLQLPEEGVCSTTGRRILLGGEVLDDRDWRVRWTQAVLVALEAGVPSLAADGSPDHVDGILNPPPNKFPLTARPNRGVGYVLNAEGTSLVADYDLLVLDRQESNAFSFGFGPDQVDAKGFTKGKKGVVVVYSGFLDEILGRLPAPVPAGPKASNGFFGNFLPTRQPTPSYNETPDVMPTPAQTKSLAVLLSHELAHLILSHTLESYASTSVLIPHVSKMLSDVARTLVYPVTAILGPFFNDAIGRSMNEGANGGFGVVGHVVNSCESRKLEQEADVVALRLLSHSGIDPRHALHFWQDRLVASSHAEPYSTVPVTSTHHVRLHSPANPGPRDKDGKEVDPACGFLRSHPVNEERVERIKQELERWMSLLATPMNNLQAA